MKTAEKIQDDYAVSKGYDNFYSLIKADLNALDYHVEKVQKLYAFQEVEKNLQTAFLLCKLKSDAMAINNIEIELT